jgi:hypothetical protein
MATNQLFSLKQHGRSHVVIPESCMKIKKNLVLIIIMASYSKIRGNTEYLTGKKDESRFIFLTFSLRLVQD